MHLKHQCSLQPPCPFWAPSDPTFQMWNRSGHTTCLLDLLGETLCWRASKISNFLQMSNYSEKKKNDTVSSQNPNMSPSSSDGKDGGLSVFDLFKAAHWLLLTWSHSDLRPNLMKRAEALNKRLDMISSMQTLPCWSVEISNSWVNHQRVPAALWPSSSPGQVGLFTAS